MSLKVFASEAEHDLLVEAAETESVHAYCSIGAHWPDGAGTPTQTTHITRPYLASLGQYSVPETIAISPFKTKFCHRCSDNSLLGRSHLPLLGDVEHHDDSITVLVHIQELCIQGHLVRLQHSHHTDAWITWYGEEMWRFLWSTCSFTPTKEPLSTHTWRPRDNHLLRLILQFQILSAPFAFAWKRKKKVTSGKKKRNVELSSLLVLDHGEVQKQKQHSRFSHGQASRSRAITRSVLLNTHIPGISTSFTPTSRLGPRSSNPLCSNPRLSIQTKRVTAS